jgi:hypothetical protein
MFKKAEFRKVWKGDLIFNGDNPDEVFEVDRKKKNLVRLIDYCGEQVTWVTEMKFNLSNYYFLEK